MELIDDFLQNETTAHEDAEPSTTVMAVAALSNADIVFKHSDNTLCLLMLKNRKSGDFAVCSFDPARSLVAAPNYRVSTALQARLYANLSKRGLSSLLDWTDRPTAVRRYADLVGEVAETERVVNLVG
jgi:hypothetical protein